MKMIVVCTEIKRMENHFTLGKTYTWEDGFITSDDGFTYSPGRGASVAGEDPSKWELSEWYGFEVVDIHDIVDMKEDCAMMLLSIGASA